MSSTTSKAGPAFGAGRALLGGDRRELLGESRIGAAGGHPTRAAGGGHRQGGRALRGGLERRPVDEQPDVAGVQGRELTARGHERSGRCRRGGPRVPEQVGVVLRQSEGGGARRGDGTRPGGGARGRGWRSARSRRGRCTGGRRRREQTASGTGGARRAKGDRERDPGRPRARRPQTAETCSSSATRKEEPQPQAATTLGLLTLKPAPCRLSS